MTVVPPLALWLLAQAPSPPPPRFEEEVVVTAERGAGPRAETPAAVSVLTREDIERLPVESLAEVLDHVPGFQVLFPEAFGQLPMVSTRGFFGGGEAEYVQLLVDGVPVADPESGIADWRRIRAVDVERVEVLRGPGSSAYGDTALGGVVQVFRRTDARETAGDVAVSGGSFGSWAADGIYRGDARVPFGIGGTASRTDGFREHSAGEEAGVDLSVGGGNGHGPWSLSLSGSLRDRDEPGPLTLEQIAADRFASDPLFRFDGEEVRRARAAVAYRRAGGTLPFRAMVHGALRDSSVLRTLLLAAGFGDRAQRDILTQALGGSFEAEKALGTTGREHRLRAGLDLGSDWLETAYRAVDEAGLVGARTAEASARRDRLGAFASGDWRASRRLTLAAGVRWDRIADHPEGGEVISNSAWSPRAGATVLMGALGRAPVSAFAQVSRAFKAATLDQLFDPRPFPDFQGGSFTVSNPALTPQRANTVEGGVFQRRRGGRWEVVAYRTMVDDEIDFDPATFRYRNIGRTRHVGVEASGRVLEARAVSPHAAYAWTRVESMEEGRRGLQLKNIPEHLLRAGLTLRLPAALVAEVRFTWSGRRWLDDANVFPFGDVHLFDLRLERRFRRLRLRLDGLNLTDTQWEPVGYTLPDFTGGVVPYAFPAPGRAVRFGVEWGS